MSVALIDQKVSKESPTSLDTHKHPAPPLGDRQRPGPRLSEPPDTDWEYNYRSEIVRELGRMEIDGEQWDKRAMALADCGLAGVVLTCDSCGTRHVVPFRCSARTCPTCSRRMAAAISDRVSARAAVHDLLMEAEPWDGPGTPQRRSWRHITLTSRALPDREARFDPATLRARVLAVRKAATAFWRLTCWGKQRRDPDTGRKRSRRDTSYVVGQEIAPGGMVHIHMLVYGEFVPQLLLEGAWSEALGEEGRVWVATVQDNAGIAKAIRESLKYTTKGEKGSRDQARHAAAVEVAFRHVKRISIGGALRRVKLAEGDGPHDDGSPEDLHDHRQLACVGCGSLGPWKWEGPVSAKVVTANGGFGYFGPLVPVPSHG